MKTRLDQVAGRRAFRAGVPIATTLLLLATLPVTAATTTSYTATGWVIGVPVPGIWFTNALGQVGIRGNAHLARVESTVARLTGRRTIFVDGGAQADGSALLYGAAYHEVGSWDLADPANPKFTPTGGMWETSYRGTMGADGSLNLHIVGTGWGGSIDGLRVEETLTRAAGAILDPAIPYQYTGTIKPPPLNTDVVLDNFDDNRVTGWSTYGPGTKNLIETNQQFTVRGYWPGVRTRRWGDSYAYAWRSRNWSVGEGQTLQWSVDVLRLNEHATAAEIVVGSFAASVDYACHLGRDFITIDKWPVDHIAVFSCERHAIKTTNVVLTFALTRANPNLILTARVLDKDNGNAVLYERRVVDTPQADSTLTTAEVEALSGMRLATASEAGGAPFMTGRIGLGLFQYTDGTQPAAEVTFDNLELWTYETP
ncbi:MAG: hypothetical protein HY674_18790 [Chloroflexi bacterium]|nr:hypothetical protein [Chloroflexota bacterium]